MIQNLRLREHTPLVIHQITQQLVFGGTQIDRLSGTGHIMRILIDLQIRDADNRIILNLLLGTAQNGTDSRNDLLKTERLGHIVVTPHGQTHDLVLSIIASRQIQHRRSDAFLTDTTGHRETVDIRKHHIKHNQIRLYFLDDFDGFRSRSRGIHFKTRKMQGCHQQLTDGRFVVNNDNGCFNRLAHALSITLFTGCFLNGF